MILGELKSIVAVFFVVGLGLCFVQGAYSELQRFVVNYGQYVIY